MKYFDTHSHLYMAQFDADRGAVLARMQELGVGSIIIGTNHKESVQAIELARQHDFLWASVGLHPNETEEFDTALYKELAKDPKVVAVGECGLDYFRSTGEGQRERFLAHIDLAEKVGKPLVIHCRDAHDDMLALLAERKPTVPVVMHFFTGSGELAQKYLDLGCHLSFPGPVTYTTMYDESMRVCPLGKMLVETDAPFAAPVPHRGGRNEPIYVAEVVKKLATIKGMEPEVLAATLVANAKKAFALALLLACLVVPLAPVSAQEPEPAVEVEVLLVADFYPAEPSWWEGLSAAAETTVANAWSGTSELWGSLGSWLGGFFNKDGAEVAPEGAL